MTKRTASPATSTPNVHERRAPGANFARRMDSGRPPPKPLPKLEDTTPPRTPRRRKTRERFAHASDSRTVDPRTMCIASHQTASDRQTISDSLGDEIIYTRRGNAEQKGHDAPTIAATHPSKFGRAETSLTLSANVDVRCTQDAIPEATATEAPRQHAIPAPPQLGH